MTVGRVEILTQQDAVIARLRGEIDLSNASAITEDVTSACDEAIRLIVDLGNVTYLDSSGVRMLFEIARRCRAADQLVTLVVPTSSPIRRLLTMTKVADVATIVSDLDDEVSRST